MEIMKLIPTGKDYLWGGTRLREFNLICNADFFSKLYLNHIQCRNSLHCMLATCRNSNYITSAKYLLYDSQGFHESWRAYDLPYA